MNLTSKNSLGRRLSCKQETRLGIRPVSREIFLYSSLILEMFQSSVFVSFFFEGVQGCRPIGGNVALNYSMWRTCYSR